MVATSRDDALTLREFIQELARVFVPIMPIMRCGMSCLFSRIH